jgi:hypothetical protein
LRYLIPTLTFILALFGLLIFVGTIRFGIGIYTPLLTIATLIGFVTLFTNRQKGLAVVFFVSLGWLLRYFEHASYLLLYDRENTGRWLIVVFPIVLAVLLLSFSYKSRGHILGRPFSWKLVILSIFAFASIGLVSFIRKPHVDEFNCWYYFDNKKDYKITFAMAPEHIWEATSNSDELRNFILNNGIRDEFREGIYCPETKVKIVTRFKKIVAVRIIGFHNTTTNVYANLKSPIDIDINKIKGDLDLLQPEFTVGD